MFSDIYSTVLLFYTRDMVHVCHEIDFCGIVFVLQSWARRDNLTPCEGQQIVACRSTAKYGVECQNSILTVRGKKFS